MCFFLSRTIFHTPHGDLRAAARSLLNKWKRSVERADCETVTKDFGHDAHESASNFFVLRLTTFADILFVSKNLICKIDLFSSINKIALHPQFSAYSYIECSAATNHFISLKRTKNVGRKTRARISGLSERKENNKPLAVIDFSACHLASAWIFLAVYTMPSIPSSLF